MKIKLTQERLHELFDYFEDGYLAWKITKGSRAGKGDIAGSVGKRGYHEIRIDDSLYKTHRIIFLWHHGYLPELIDHIDQDRLNNKVENLREVSKQCNARNCKIHSTNTSGVTGVRYVDKRKRWISKIIENGKELYLGVYKEFDDAVMARWKKEVEINWNGCNSTSSAYLHLKEKGLI